MRQELSDQPVLQWKPVDPPIHIAEWRASDAASSTVGPRVVSGFFSAEDGRVAIAIEEDESYRLEVTSNGVDWTAFALPAGTFPREVHISGDRWIVAGRALESGDSQVEPFNFDNVLLSEDGGGTWSEVRVDPGTPPFVDTQYLATVALHGSGDRIVLVSLVHFSPRFAELIEDRGLIDSTDGVEPVGIGDRTVVMWMPSDDSGGDFSIVDLSYDELELSPEQATAAELWFASVRRGFSGHVRIYAGDADGLSPTGDFNFDSVSSAAGHDGFMLSVGAWDGDSRRLFASADGQQWTEVPVDPPVLTHLAGARHDGALWAYIPGDGAATKIATFGCGQAPRPVAAFENLTFGRSYVDNLAVGASGLAAAAWLGGPSEPMWVGWSTDGTHWDWQAAVDAFGFESHVINIDIAVGDGFVLAAVDGAYVNEGGWFVAAVP